MIAAAIHATEDGSGQMDEQGGVWRFDGKSFTKFTTKEGLIHNGVFCTVEDQDGNLWFGTRNMGLRKYDGKVFTKFSEQKKYKAKSNKWTQLT